MADTLGQPLVAAFFVLGGAVGYVVYEFFYMFKETFPLKIFSLISDLFACVSNGAIFLFVAINVNYGQMLFYEFFCYAVGFLLMRILLKNTLRRLFSVLNKKLKEYFNARKTKAYNFLKARHTTKERRKQEYETRRMQLRTKREQKLMQLRRRRTDEHTGKIRTKRLLLPMRTGIRSARSVSDGMHRQGKRGTVKKIFTRQSVYEFID